MVIQRTWKIEQTHAASSSEDSNSSWNMGSGNPRQCNNTIQAGKSIATPQIAESVLKALRHRYSGRSSLKQSSSEAAARAMELMRANIQVAFDKEVDAIVTKYIDTFMKPALKNVKENLGDDALNGNCLQQMSCSLLEHAKIQYIPQFVLPTVNNVPPVPPIEIKIEKIEKSESELSDSDSSSLSTSVATKRKESSDNDSDAGPSVKKIRPIVPARTYTRAKQIFWNTSNLNADTQFVLDFKVNRAFGFLDNKEKVASKHPDLIRYLPDNVDRDWLTHHKLISPLYKNSRFLFLVLNEVQTLSRTEEYRSKSNIRSIDSEGFKVPEFIQIKMRKFFSELSSKSQGLFTSALMTLPMQSDVPSTTVATNKPKSSLSSSHATLTALLSNTQENTKENNEH